MIHLPIRRMLTPTPGRFAAGPAATLHLLLIAGLLVVATGCGSAPRKSLPAQVGDASRAMPEKITAYGYQHVNGRLLDPARLNSNERLSLADAQRAGLFGVQGIRYQTVVAVTEEDRTVSSSIAYGGDLVNMVVTQRDSLEVPGSNSHWLVTTLEVPFVYNAGDALEQAVSGNVAYLVEVPVARGSGAGPKFVALRALEAVLAHKYNGAAGTWEGTAFVLRNQPRVESMSIGDRNPDRRWTTGSGPSMKIAGDTKTKMLVCDVEIVIAEEFQTAALQSATLQPFEKVLPGSVR